MKTIPERWKTYEEYFALTAALSQKKPVLYTGVPVLAGAALTAALYEDIPQPVLILTPTEDDAVAFAENLRPFLGDRVQHFPVLELLPFEVYAHNIELISARVNVLSRLSHGERLCVVASVAAVSRLLPPPDTFADAHLELFPGQVIRPEELAHKLADLGYEHAALTDIPGAFSQRGSIVDVFPVTSRLPYRIEFFDDEIDSIRSFDPAAQRSAEAVTALFLPPARELPLDDAARQRASDLLQQEYDEAMSSLHGHAKKELEGVYAPLLDYLPRRIWDNGMDALIPFFYPHPASLVDYMRDGLILLRDPERICSLLRDGYAERQDRYADLLEAGRLLPSYFDNFLTEKAFFTSLNGRRLFMQCHESFGAGPFLPQLELHLSGRDLSVYASDPNLFAEDLTRFTQKHYVTYFTASSEVRLQRMGQILREHGSPPARLVQAGFTKGFECAELKIAVITEQELFARKTRRRRRRQFSGGEKIANFLDLKVGDYVVHVSQGIGQYLGVERLTVGDAERDYLLIHYAGEDKLYVPVDQLDLIQKYVGGEGNAPRLNKLGGSEWNRTKAKVRAAVQEMTDQLLALYAARQQAEGYAFAADTPWQRDFEDAFPYAETDDQLSAWKDIREDMESNRIMDRLLCGDVGFGKTEIAMRAIFKAVTDGKQAALLAPTTVLAQQHYRTILERFSGFPVSAGSLSRFVSAAEQKKTLARLADGSLDILVGTHRMLSSDVQFKDLGLLVVDEEQRFGVAHKEKIKELKKQVDVLTLSATPIPRTLHMSLVGMRDMSIIATAPEDRRPVQTYVVEYHPRLIRDAIARELARGGQVYYVHNRVSDLQDIVDELQEMLPSARILVGHGQMKEKELEQVMMDFVAGEGDILVCTTIIENGLDISNANTMIVSNANMYGLSQLYQLRGRVGRSDRQAFAYFTYRREDMLSDIARKRLIAIRDFTELGSGFKIAMRDLELRGAGNLLGPEQHGHIAAVGFDLYCRLLEEEMNKAKGEAPKDVPLATQIDLGLSAYIPDDFVDDSLLKVEIYKRLAAAENFAVISELSEELSDRYGEFPVPVEHLIIITRIKTLCRKLRILSVMQRTEVIDLRFADDHPIRMEHVLQLLKKWSKRIVLSEKKGFSIKFSTKNIHVESLRSEMLCKMLAELWQIISGKNP